MYMALKSSEELKTTMWSRLMECDRIYFKQWGGSTTRSTGRELERRIWNETPAMETRGSP
jgi:protein gp37